MRGVDDPYWSRPAGELSATLDSSAAGLTNAEAAARLRRCGSNAIRAESPTSAVRLLWRQFSSPLVLILVFGAFVCLLLQDWVDAAIVLAIVLGSALLGFAQEYRASTAIARLRERLALTTQVRRQGELKTLPSASIVPGDVVMLSAGNLVPADGVVLEARDFLVTEASLTGESLPVEKRPGAVAADAPLSGRSNCVWCGTSVRSGTATILVVRTGERTAFGKVAIRLRERPPETEFVHGLRSFGHLLFQIMIGMVLLVMMVSLLLGRPLVDSLLFAVALAVGLSPELLPAIVSVTQAAGARAMARRGVIVRHLESIENLGSIDILCTDKTGTLTEGVMSLAAAVDPMGRASEEVGRLAFLNAAFETGIDNPLDAALVKAGKAQGLSTQGWRKIDEIPYDFRRKRVTIVASRQDDAGCEIIVKGAFANVLDVCTAVTTDEGHLPLDEGLRQQLEDRYRERGTQGLRVLALATRRAPLKPHFEHADEQGLCFRGFLEFIDPPKEDARRAIQDLLGLGVKLKIVSGDNRYVTAHLAEAVGLRADTMLTGAEIATLNDEALWHRAERADLFVEVDPQQKERIVRALQRTGHAVGYLGDGINDAAALHSADVGISVDQAVDVARESADVVLMRPSLDVLAHRHPGRAADFRQHAEVHLHHHQRQLREHGEHGAGHELPALPAAGGQADPAEQLPVGPAVDADRQRCGRCAVAGGAATLARARHPILHARLRADQLGVRHPDLRAVDPGVRRGRKRLPERVVRGVPADGTCGRAGAEDKGASLAQRAEPAARMDHGRGGRHRPGHSHHRPGRGSVRSRTLAAA